MEAGIDCCLIWVLQAGQVTGVVIISKPTDHRSPSLVILGDLDVGKRFECRYGSIFSTNHGFQGMVFWACMQSDCR